MAKNGTGGGTVTDSTSAIHCGTTCSAQFPRTTTAPMVTLTAVPNAGSTFAGWAGGGCTGTGTCAVTLSAATTVTATFNEQQVTLSVSFRAIGVGQTNAVITSTPPGISCTGEVCTTSASFNLGQVVTLTVAGLGSGALSAWRPATCSGTTCAVTVNADQTVTFTATTNNIVFVSSQTHSGNFGGLAGANAFCQGLASAAALPGQFVAFLGTQSGSTITQPYANLGSARGWIRPDGLAFTDTVAGFQTSGISWYPPAVTDLGNVITGAELLYVGLAPNSSCSNWTDGTSTQATTGFSPADEDGYWTGIETGSCSAENVTCFGTDFTATPASVVPVAGRHVFVSAGNFTPSAGRAAADLLCQGEAATAGLANPTHFLAAPSETTASAASRFNLAGAAWVRPDGVQVASTPANFMQAMLMAPIYVGANGLFDITSVWTGSSMGLNGASASPMESCDDWTSATLASGGWIGVSAWGISGISFASNDFGCTSSPRSSTPQLICLEN